MNLSDDHENIIPTPNDQKSAGRRISRAALIGAIILPFGLFLGLYLIPVSARTTPAPPTTWQIILRYTLLPLSILAPFISTILGFIGIRDIRNSKRKKYGMPLAVFVALFYPIIFITLILFMLGWLFLGNIEGWNIIPLIWFFTVLVIDYFLIRVVWNIATRKN